MWGEKKNKHLFNWKVGKKVTAWLLIFSIFFQTLTVSAQELPNELQEQILEEAVTEMENHVEQAEQSESSEPLEPSEPSAPLPESQESDSMQEENLPENESLDEQNQTPTEEEIPIDLYENGVIKVYNIRQLQAIGTGEPVRTDDMQEELFSTGTELVSEGQTITYALDAAYMLMNEIPLSSEAIWNLPEGFTGTFSGTPVEDDVLYDQETDTVYIYNNYQLQLIASENSAEEPVMSNDMIPEKVGVGQLLYKDGTPADESAEAAQENT